MSEGTGDPEPVEGLECRKELETLSLSKGWNVGRNWRP